MMRKPNNISHSDPPLCLCGKIEDAPFVRSPETKTYAAESSGEIAVFCNPFNRFVTSAAPEQEGAQ